MDRALLLLLALLLRALLRALLLRVMVYCFLLLGGTLAGCTQKIATGLAPLSGRLPAARAVPGVRFFHPLGS